MKRYHGLVKVFFIIIAMQVSIFAQPSFCEQKLITLETTISRGSALSERHLYWNIAPAEEILTPHATPINSPSSNFSVSIPVKKGDIMDVKFYGSIWGNTYIYIIATGPCSMLSPFVGGVFGWSKQHLVYRPFQQHIIVKATADGIVSFYQECYMSDLNTPNLDYPVKLFGRVAMVELIGQVVPGETVRPAY